MRPNEVETAVQCSICRIDMLTGFSSHGNSIKIIKLLYSNVLYIYIYISGAETGLVPGTTNNSVNVIQNGLKIIH